MQKVGYMLLEFVVCELKGLSYRSGDCHITGQNRYNSLVCGAVSWCQGGKTDRAQTRDPDQLMNRLERRRSKERVNHIGAIHGPEEKLNYEG